VPFPSSSSTTGGDFSCPVTNQDTLKIPAAADISPRNRYMLFVGRVLPRDKSRSTLRWTPQTKAPIQEIGVFLSVPPNSPALLRPNPDPKTHVRLISLLGWTKLVQFSLGDTPPPRSRPMSAEAPSLLNRHSYFAGRLHSTDLEVPLQIKKSRRRVVHSHLRSRIQHFWKMSKTFTDPVFVGTYCINRNKHPPFRHSPTIRFPLWYAFHDLPSNLQYGTVLELRAVAKHRPASHG
jgi:hypothetical protein